MSNYITCVATSKPVTPIRKTSNKRPPSPETVQFFHESPKWKMENEFYEFAREQFQFVKERTLTYRADRIAAARLDQSSFITTKSFHINSEEIPSLYRPTAV